MKNRPTKLLLSLVTAGLMFGAASASADRGDRHHRDPDRVYDRDYRHDDQRYYKHDKYYKKDKYYKNDRHYKKRHYKNERIKLDLPVRLRGSDRIKLRRLANYHYGIDLDNYRLVRVVVNGHGRRHHGTAQLRVGRYHTQAKYLDGRTAFKAPDARRHAPWVLGIDRARVNNIRLVLEPRNRYAYKHRRHHDDWVAYQGHHKHGHYKRVW